MEEIEIIITVEKILGSLTENLERPFNVNVATVSTEDATGSLYYEENFDSANLSVQMDALIKQMKTGMNGKMKRKSDLKNSMILLHL